MVHIKRLFSRVVPDLTISNPTGAAGSGFGDNSFFGSQPSAMLSAAITRQHSSVLRHCLPVFDEICGRGMVFVFFRPGITLIKIANTPLDRSAALVLSVIN